MSEVTVDDPTPEIVPVTPEIQATPEEDRIRAIAVAQGWRETGKLDPVEFLESIPKYSETLVNKLSALESRYDKLSKVLGGQITAENERAKANARQQIIEATEKGDSEAVLRAAEVLHAPVQTFDDVAIDTQAVVKAWTDACKTSAARKTASLSPFSVASMIC